MGSFGGRHWSRPGAAHLPELGGAVPEFAAEDACSSCSSVEAFSFLNATCTWTRHAFCALLGVVNLDVPFYYVWGCLVVGCHALELNERWHFYPPSLELLVAHFGDWS